MERDINLIRQILKEVEAHDGVKGPWQTSDPQAAYNIGLLVDAGLVDARILKSSKGQPCGAGVLGLTWAGHDFLDASKDDTIWNHAKEKVVKPGVAWTFSLLLELLKQEAKSKLGLQ